MTTIVCDRFSMGADKLISGGPSFKGTKIYRINGSLIGFAGSVEQGLKFIEWRKNIEGRPQFSLDCDFEAIELTPEGKIKWWGPEIVGMTVEDSYYAIGSGAMAALGAMAAGANIKTALKIASKYDSNTGSEFQMMTLRSSK